MSLQHRRTLLASAAGSAVFGSFTFATPAHAQTGTPNPDLAPFDDLLVRFVADQQLPGAQLAVSKDQRLVYARGFGLADRDQQRPVQPTDLFRIASVSKPVTAAAILQLVEGGATSLDTNVWQQLGLAAPADARWKRVTIRHLLQHTGGWDREKRFDPMFEVNRIARALKLTRPATPQQVIEFMLAQPLDFDPGSQHAYSNFGYCVLGRVIERVAGAGYEQYVQQQVLGPLGIRRMRLGRTAIAQRAPSEVTYYVDRSHSGAAVSGTTRAGVPLPYGAWSLEAMDSHGGWLASAPDLVRFACAFDVPATCKILRPASITTMFARPAGPAGFDANGKPKQVYYACGWRVRSLGRGDRINTWHTGHLDGTSTLLVRRYDGRNWAALFNAHSTPDGQRVADKIDPLLHTAADQVRRWSDGDQFQALL